MKNSSLFSLTYNRASAVLSAIGIISLSDFVLEFPSIVQNWISIWKETTYPPWKFLLGRVFDATCIDLTPLIMDYLTMGIITAGMMLRYTISINSSNKNANFQNKTPKSLSLLLRAGLSFFFWPLAWILVGIVTYQNTKPKALNRYLIWSPIPDDIAVQTDLNEAEKQLFNSKRATFLFFESLAYAVVLILLSQLTITIIE